MLEPLGPDRRRVLGVLCEIGGADDRLASAAIGESIDVAAALAGVPLVARNANGWHVPHALWRRAPRLALPPADAAAVRRRAVADLSEGGRFDDAFAIIDEAGLWDLAPALLRDACVTRHEITADELDRWLSACPPAVKDTLKVTIHVLAGANV